MFGKIEDPTGTTTTKTTIHHNMKRKHRSPLMHTQHQLIEMHTLPTPQVIELQRLIEEQYITYLVGKLDDMSEQELKHALDQLAKEANQAVNWLHVQLAKWNFCEPDSERIRINLRVYSAGQILSKCNGFNAWGFARADKGYIGLLDLLALAPKDVIWRVVVHEWIHMLYPFLDRNPLERLTIRPDIKINYREQDQEEEEWVRQMEERCCGKVNLLELWIHSIVDGKDNWRPIYNDLKKSSSCRFHSNTTPMRYRR